MPLAVGDPFVQLNVALDRLIRVLSEVQGAVITGADIEMPMPPDLL